MSHKSVYPMAERVRLGIDFLNYLHEHGPSTAQEFCKNFDADCKLVISAVLLLKYHSAIIHENDNCSCKTWLPTPGQDVAAVQAKLAIISGSANTSPVKTANATRRESEARASSPWKATRCTASAKTTAAAGSVGACSAAWWPSSQWETSAPSAPQRGRDGAPVTRTSRAHSSNRQRKAVRAWTREKAY